MLPIESLRYPIYDLNLPFKDYITLTKEMILSKRPSIKQDELSLISPYELKPAGTPKGGVLLIHGLLDTTFMMRDVGNLYYKNDFLVRSILLPGHGLTPNELLNVSYHQWIQAVKYGIASLAKEVGKIHLVGFSTGATLALQHISLHNDIEKAILLNPAIKIRSHFDFSSNWHRIISWAWKRAQWLHITEENDFAKYQSIPLNAAYQVYLLSKLFRKLSKTHAPSCPLFFILSMADSTVSAKASLEYFHQHFNPNNRLLVYSSKLSHTQDINTLVRTSVYPEMNIHEFSHIGIPIAPNNPHYGKNGNSHQASHIDPNNPVIYGGFNRLQNMIYEWLYQKKLLKVPRRRLSFNPDFDFMAKQIDSFLMGDNDSA